jgi:hypothetical protein
MEDRIQINGVWYVREEQPTKKIDWDITTYNGRVYESDLYCFKITQILNEDGLPYNNSCDIEITDKRVKPWKVEHVDNQKWFIGVLQNNPESMVEANKMFCEQGIAEFQSVISDLMDNDWIKS